MHLGLYSIHPALPWFLKALFDRAHPAAAGGTPPAVQAYVAAMGELANHWHHQIGQGRHEALAMLRHEEPNLLQARALAIRHGWWDRAVSAMQGLRQVHRADGRWTAWADLVADLVPLVEDPATGDPLPGREEKWFFTAEYRVELADRRRDPAAALALLERSVAVNRRRAAAALAADPASLDKAASNRLRTLGASLLRLGDLLRQQGDAACVAHFTEAKEIDDRLGLKREAAVAAFNLGHAYLWVPALRDLDRAAAWYQESLESRDESDRIGRATCHEALGSVAWARFSDAVAAGNTDRADLAGHAKAALEGYDTALSLLPEGARAERAVSHNQLGGILTAIGQTDAAIRHYRESIRHAEAAGNPFGAARTAFNLAFLFARNRRFDDALAYARHALTTFETYGPNAAAEIAKTRTLIAAIEQARASAPAS